MRPLILICSLLICGYTYCQKKRIDISATEGFSTLRDASITKDSNYIYYLAQSNQQNNLMIYSTLNDFSKTVNNVSDVMFTQNDRYIIFKQGRDSFFIFDLKKKRSQVEFISGKYIVAEGKNHNWISWRSGFNHGDLTIWNSSSDVKIKYRNIEDWCFSRNERGMVLIERLRDSAYNLHWVDLATFKDSVLWMGSNAPESIKIQCNSGKIAFTTTSKNEGTVIHIVSLSGDSITINDGFTFRNSRYRISGDNIQFDRYGERISFDVRLDTLVSANIDGGGPDVWHYRDSILQPEQRATLRVTPESEMAYLYFSQKNIRVVDRKEGEEIVNIGANAGDNEYLVLKRNNNKPDQRQYDPFAGYVSIYLYSFIDGSRTCLVADGRVPNVFISPSNRYLIYVDRNKGACYCYEMAKKKLVKISSFFPPEFFYFDKRDNIQQAIFQVEGWTANDFRIVMGDGFDLWLIDPSGLAAARAVTGSYGKTQHLHLHAISPVSDSCFSNARFACVLKGENEDTYDEGFYRFANTYSAPIGKKLWSGPYRVDVRKKVGRFYIVSRSSVNEENNLFYSSDLKFFIRITNFCQHCDYKWYNARLLKWRGLDGAWMKGIIYEPESLDVNEKYPVIFSIYGIQTPILNTFEYPSLSDGGIDVAWFVSRGYIVFKPDINYLVGAPGESVCNSIISAVAYLKKIKWIDSEHLGISGVSLGGYAVNYLVTKSHAFAAAAPGFGMTNLTSSYGDLRDFNRTNQWDYETGIPAIGGTLWDKGDLYVKNSPIFYADKVTTPLLIVHNKLDPFVSWSQGVQWFMALRRLKKRVWLLQYDGEGHGLDEFQNQIDYTKRLEQFFGYYLKGDAPPVWMVRGIPAAKKGIDKGFSMDSSGKVP